MTAPARRTRVYGQQRRCRSSCVHGNAVSQCNCSSFPAGLQPLANKLCCPDKYRHQPRSKKRRGRHRGGDQGGQVRPRALSARGLKDGKLPGRWTLICKLRDSPMRTIAIHPDHFVHRNGERQSFSDRWSELADQAGIEVRAVDAYRQDIFDRLHGCDAFMWRFDFAAPERLFAKRLLAAIEQTMPLAVFPSWRTAWHFEDKVAQHYLLTAAAIPTARTWVFWDAASARAFCRDARYPLVLKLAQGYLSSNVRLMRDAAEAKRWIDLLFTTGVASLDQRPVSMLRSAARHAREAVRALCGKS